MTLDQTINRSGLRASDQKVIRLAFTQDKKIIHPSNPRDSSDYTRIKRLTAKTQHIQSKSN